MGKKSLKDYRNQLAARLRAYELKRAGKDEEAVEALAHTSDGLLLRKWLWIATVVGGLASFVAMPVILSLLSTFMPAVVIDVLWFVLKTMMAVILVTFVLLACVTVRSET